jgi:hypothetical protein
VKGSLFKFIIEPSKIAFLKFILEGYDHLAILTILDPHKGFCTISFYPKEKELVQEILQDFRVEFLEN